MRITSYVVWVALLTIGLGCGDPSHAVHSETVPDTEEGAARIEGEDARPIQPKTPVEAIANANPEEAPEGRADTPTAEITEIDSTGGNDNSGAAKDQPLLPDLPEGASVFHSQIGTFTIEIPSEMRVTETLGGQLYDIMDGDTVILSIICEKLSQELLSDGKAVEDHLRRRAQVYGMDGDIVGWRETTRGRFRVFECATQLTRPQRSFVAHEIRRFRIWVLDNGGYLLMHRVSYGDAGRLTKLLDSFGPVDENRVVDWIQHAPSVRVRTDGVYRRVTERNADGNPTYGEYFAFAEEDRVFSVDFLAHHSAASDQILTKEDDRGLRQGLPMPFADQPKKVLEAIRSSKGDNFHQAEYTSAGEHIRFKYEVVVPGLRHREPRHIYYDGLVTKDGIDFIITFPQQLRETEKVAGRRVEFVEAPREVHPDGRGNDPQATEATVTETASGRLHNSR